MNLFTLSNLDLEIRLQDLVQKERKLLHLILLHIREVDRRKLYLEKACPSLFDYLTKKMSYSPAAAQRRIEASRLLRDLPALAEKIQSGAVNLTQVGELAKAIKQKEKESSKIAPHTKLELLEKIENKNTFETQKILAQELDLNLKPLEIKRVQKDESIHLQITLTKEQYEKLIKCKDKASHKLQSKQDTGLASTIEVLMDQYLSVKPNLKCSKGAQPTTARITGAEGNLRATRINKTLTPKTKQQVLADQKCCQYKDLLTGNTCQNTFALEIDHKKPRWAGGTHELENLQVLCSQHNKYKYQKQAQIRLL